MSDTGSEYLFQGMSNLGKGIGDAIAAHRKLSSAARSSETIFKLLNPDQKPVSDEEFANLSSRDKVAMTRGIFEQQGYQRAQADMAAVQERTRGLKQATDQAAQADPIQLNILRQQEAEMQRQAEQAKAAGARKEALNAKMVQLFDPARGGASKVDPNAVFGAIASTGNAMDPQTDNLLTSLGKVQSLQSTAGMDFTPKAVDIGGNPFAYSPRTGQLTPNPKMQEIQPMPLHDAEGNLLGHALIDPRTGKATMMKSNAPGPSDLLKFEETLSKLDADIASQEAFKKSDKPEQRAYFDQSRLEGLKARRATVMEHYSKSFPSKAAGEAATSSSSAAPKSGSRAIWTGRKDGTIQFSK